MSDRAIAAVAAFFGGVAYLPPGRELDSLALGTALSVFVFFGLRAIGTTINLRVERCPSAVDTEVTKRRSDTKEIERLTPYVDAFRREERRADHLEEVAEELRDAAMSALETLVSCVVPSGGCDDAKTIAESIAMLRSALGDTRPLPQ